MFEKQWFIDPFAGTEEPQNISKGYFPLGGIFRAERHFLLFKDQLAESGRQKTKKISFRAEIPPSGNGP